MATTLSDEYQKIPLVDEIGTSNESLPPPYPVKTVQPGSHVVCGEPRPEPKMGGINFAIFAIICCFWPLGLVALLKAIKGMQAHYHGDLQSAKAMNDSSKKWSIASIVVQVVLVVGCYLFFVLVYSIPPIIISVIISHSNKTDGYDQWTKTDHNQWMKDV